MERSALLLAVAAAAVASTARGHVTVRSSAISWLYPAVPGGKL